MSWLGLYGFAWTDYEVEAAPAFSALVHGQFTRFMEQLPAYGGSLEMRAPIALLVGLVGGDELAVYRAVALPCLLAGAVLGVWLVSRMRAAGRSRLSRGVVLGLCVGNPITLRALELGHPEELLGAVLCVAAVLVATRNRPVLAGLLLGLAIANKQWALLAVGPVLVAIPAKTPAGEERVRATFVGAVVACAFLIPMLSFHPPGATSSAGIAVSQSGAIFQPEQVFWFAGDRGHAVRGLFGQLKPGYRTPPSWLGGLAHPLIIALAVPLTLLCLGRRRRGCRPGDALLLLSLLLLLRCVLDPWDAVYYPLPFLLAVLGWEATTKHRPPVLSLTAAAGVWSIFVWLPETLSADATSAASMAIALPAATALAVALYGGRARSAVKSRRRAAAISRRSPTPW
ncbi:MAG: glycosyltransferase 87 family protein [Solirubrobacteraceae bacterium]